MAPTAASRYRRQRLAELKAARLASRFGELRQLCRASYVQEVTEASAGGQWVLLLLYTDVTWKSPGVVNYDIVIVHIAVIIFMLKGEGYQPGATF